MAEQVSGGTPGGVTESQAFVLLMLANSHDRDLKYARGLLTRVLVDESGCWLWAGSMTPNGYGKFYMGGRSKSGYRQPEGSHRASYRLFVGPIPDGLELDHLCKTTRCANPLHLEAVDHRTNLMRSTGMAARYAAQTHCKRGHLKCPENTYYRNGKPQGCRICQAIREKARTERRRQERQERA
jgi:hypothetical protein